MLNTERMKSFIIKVVYVVLLALLAYCIFEYALPFFMPFVLGLAIAFILKRPINHLAKKLKWSRKIVAVIMLSLVYVLLGGILVFAGGKLFVFLSGLFEDLPHFYQNTIDPALGAISDWFDGFIAGFDPAVLSFIDAAGDSISQSVSSLISSLSSGALNMLTGVVGRVPWIVVSFVMTIISSYFFVVDYYPVTRFFVRQFSEKSVRLILVIKDFVVNVLFKYVKAYFILLSITFLEVSVGMLILQVPHPFLIALLTAIVDILPVFGTGTILIPWAAYSLLTQKYFLGIGLLVLYAVITVIRQVLEPRVVGKQIGLYPLLTLISMFVGARFFGFWGLFGLPIALTVIIHLNRTGEIHIFKE